MNKHRSTPAWEILGFSRDDLDAIAANMVASFKWWSGPPMSSDDVESWVSDATREGIAVFAMGSMGYPIAEPPLNDWQEVGRRVLAAVAHYFFGSWREHFRYFAEEFDSAKARAELGWSSQYREGLALAVSLGDWVTADRLLEWPGPDLRSDEGMDDRTQEDNAYQIWLALQLRGESTNGNVQRKIAQRRPRGISKDDLYAAEVLRKAGSILPGTKAIVAAVQQREIIARGSRRRPKMLLAAADALLKGDAGSLADGLGAYLRHYRQREMRPNRVDLGVCLDGTVLWHLAKRRGLGEVPLPEDLGILIAKP